MKRLPGPRSATRRVIVSPCCMLAGLLELGWLISVAWSAAKTYRAAGSRGPRRSRGGRTARAMAGGTARAPAGGDGMRRHASGRASPAVTSPARARLSRSEPRIGLSAEALGAGRPPPQGHPEGHSGAHQPFKEDAEPLNGSRSSRTTHAPRHAGTAARDDPSCPHSRGAGLAGFRCLSRRRCRCRFGLSSAFGGFS